MNQKTEQKIHEAWAEGYKTCRKELINLKTFKIGGRLLRTTASRMAVRDAIETGTERFENGELNLDSLLERLTLRGWFAQWECVDDLSFREIE